MTEEETKKNEKWKWNVFASKINFENLCLLSTFCTFLLLIQFDFLKYWAGFKGHFSEIGNVS